MYPGHGRQAFIIELLEGGKVTRHDVQHVVGIAKQALGRKHTLKSKNYSERITITDLR